MRELAANHGEPRQRAEEGVFGAGRVLIFLLVASASVLAQAVPKSEVKPGHKKLDASAIDWSKVKAAKEGKVAPSANVASEAPSGKAQAVPEATPEEEVEPAIAPVAFTSRGVFDLLPMFPFWLGVDLPAVGVASVPPPPPTPAAVPTPPPPPPVAPPAASRVGAVASPAVPSSAPAEKPVQEPRKASSEAVRPVPPVPQPSRVQDAPVRPLPVLESDFRDGQVEGKTGLDTRPYLPIEPADKNKWRRPWNIRPVSFYGRVDTLRFKGFDGQTPDGPIHTSLGNNAGVGFGGALEAFPFTWGAVFFSWDYRYGFASGLSVDGPALYKVDQVKVKAEHQVAFGVHAGFKLPWQAEWSIGLEQRAERYKASGPSGSPSSAWLQRPWLKVGARWSLDMIRDLRPFIGVDVAIPLKRFSVGSAEYAQDLSNLLGIYGAVPPGGTPSTVASDGIARAHGAEFQFTVSYGIRLFRPRRKWRPPVVGVETLPVKPKASEEYQVPKEATTPGSEQEKKKQQ